jgi:hypothetical protein
VALDASSLVGPPRVGDGRGGDRVEGVVELVPRHSSDPSVGGRGRTAFRAHRPGAMAVTRCREFGFLIGVEPPIGHASVREKFRPLSWGSGAMSYPCPTKSHPIKSITTVLITHFVMVYPSIRGGT